MNFQPFDPSQPVIKQPLPQAGGNLSARRDGAVYHYDEDIILAVDAARAARRPLLVEGAPGTGKSSLARNVADTLGWRYYEKVITSRTQAQDLLWTFDSLRRMRDGMTNGQLKPDHAYVEPGVLWWALDRASAMARGAVGSLEGVPEARDPAEDRMSPNAVVLLDEIDKADPDIPNDLLGPLNSGTFEITDLHRWIKAPPLEQRPDILLVITTNGERQLSPAFLRRCVRLELKPHSVSDMITIAGKHFGPDEGALYRKLAEWTEGARREAKAHGDRPPSTAEFLDAVAVCLKMKITPDSPTWQLVSRFVLAKSARAEQP